MDQRVLLAKVLADLGVDPSLVNAALEAQTTLYIPILLFNLGQFIAWIIVGTVVIRTNLAPKWAGIAVILGVPSIITAQAFYFHLEIFWPLANIFWVLGVWGLVKSYRN